MKTLLRGSIHGVKDADGVLVDGDTIAWIGRGQPPERPDEELIAEPGEVIVPGALPASGVTAFLPTLISSPVEACAAFVASVGAAAESRGARVLGAHVEGPFINPSFQGAHLRDNLTHPTPEKIDVFEAAHPRMVTLAPELPGALAAIERLHRAGIVVSAGHTGADFELGRRAIAAGIRFGTHIYSAMLPVHHRNPGIALALLLDARVTVGLIADGVHVHPAVCEQLIRVKGTSRIALTTDQTSAAGSPAGTYSLSGRSVVSDGRVVRLDDGTLAGSAARMDDLVRFMAKLPGMTANRAVELATEVPARVLGEQRLGRIREGACSDLVVLGRDLKVRLTMVRGVVQFRR
jgi:N-acetylglucosamine-6-phosphate deacetylase